MSDNSVDDFLAHYGVRGMKWGVRKAEKRARKEADKKARKDIMKDKHLDQIVERRRKEKQLKSLLDDDLNPKSMAAKRFVSDFLKENDIAVGSALVTGVTAAAGVAFMAVRLNNSFANISLSPIPLR